MLLQSHIAGRWVGHTPSQALKSALNGQGVAHTHADDARRADLAECRGDVTDARMDRDAEHAVAAYYAQWSSGLDQLSLEPSHATVLVSLADAAVNRAF